ncbi:trypsin-like peptidase domain-containing protein [Bradyrhizobium archetypum]|uniref:Trypsin-like serine protease n=1 Tax=Bradyrhizobium archetypum TaxID=2721160 RepID=A0A7Y4HA45_9BRAD|nr:trypsin-like peptidase domain-containing protein [Bradyrhizobium archetypum]NOJ50451.1 trypsin-like serine protease [Bradyrhizobium archetypum]
MRTLNKITRLLVAAFVGVSASALQRPAWGQPAPAMRAVVSADAAPEAMSQLFAKLGAGERTISVPGAAWLQLQFSEVRLGPDGVLTITGASGESQRFSQAQIDAWGGLTAVFNGSELRVSLVKGATEPVSASIKEIIIGLPAGVLSRAEVVVPRPLRNLLGPDFKRFIPGDLRRELRKEGVAPREGVDTESICGSTDDRVASANPRAGRIMPVGCTGWLIEGGNLLSAGHCVGTTFQTVEFNVPASLANGTTVAPPVRDQYRIIAGSIVSQDGGVGNDWAVFQVLPNTQTGLMPAAAQGATFQLSNTDNPAQVRVTGYGVDGPAPNFGAGGGARNAQSQTQQTHVGTLSQNTGGATSGVLRYDTDTQGGNSGSPVIVEGGNIAIGIHTNAGCAVSGGTNAGTSFRNAALWTALPGTQSGWRVFHSTGDRLRNLDVGRNGDGRLEVFGVAPDNTIWNTWQVAPSNGWNGSWNMLYSSGDQLRDLRVARNLDGRLEVFGVAPDDTIWHTWQVAPSNGWNGSWEILYSSSDRLRSLEVGQNADGRLEVFGVAPDNTIWNTWQVAPSNGWNGSWNMLYSSGDQLRDLRVARNLDGRLEVFGVAPDDTIWHTWQVAPSNGWNGSWEILYSSSDRLRSLEVGQNADGRLEIFGVAPDNTIWNTWQVAPSNGWNGSWNILYSSGDQLRSLDVGRNGDGRLELFGVAPDDTIWHTWQVGPSNGWNGSWLMFYVPGDRLRNLDVGQNADGRIEVFGIASNDTIWHTWQVAPSDGWNR